MVIPLGTILEIPGGKNYLTCNFEKLSPADISQIELNIDGVTNQYTVNTDLLYSYHGGATASNDIAKALSDINTTIGKIGKGR